MAREGPLHFLPGYSVLETLHTGGRSEVLLARRDADGLEFVLKGVRTDRPSQADLFRLRNEYLTSTAVDCEGVARCHGLESQGLGLVLIREYCRGEELGACIPEGGFSIDRFLTLALQLTRTLGALHAAGVIHKDLNPSNIILDEPGKAMLIDLGISSRLSKETSSLRSPEQLEGTLAYVSPEQTGRTERPLDYRTDLYSLGATLYQMLTGALPFEASDAMELIYSHLARTPLSPEQRRADVPRPLSDILLKLLAKSPDSRYQSAHGLASDLERCVHGWSTSGRLEAFEPGGRDLSEHFEIPQRLYGRDDEIARLFATFEAVPGGRAQFALISGFSGIGKSALVREVRQPVMQARGCFIEGKADQLRRDRPLDPFRLAFADLTRQILTESESSVKQWREQILEAAGPNGRILVELVQEIELLIGPQPDVPALPAQAARNRFHLLMRGFVRALARPQRPLVLFLDDLQWADSSSLQLLELLITDPEITSLLVIGSYRDHEVDSSHPLALTLASIRATDAPVQEIRLGPLEPEPVEALVADTVKLAAEEARPLARLVGEKTGGNPFFVRRWLASLAMEGLLVRDPQGMCWRWDLDRVSRRAATENVVELLGRQLASLELPTREQLRLAACFGSRFDLRQLASIACRPLREMVDCIAPAVQAGLIEPVGDSQALARARDPDSWCEEEIAESAFFFRFAHDRIQQAAYALNPEQERRQIHLQIGRLMLAGLDERKLDDALSDLVHQLNVGLELVEEPAERLRVARLNERAGRKAMRSAAFGPALAYFRTGLEAFTPEQRSSEPQLLLELTSQAAEAALLTGDFEASDELCGRAFTLSRAPLEKTRVHVLRIRAHQFQGRTAEALRAVREALSVLGVWLPDRVRIDHVLRALANTLVRIGSRSMTSLLAHRTLEDPEKREAMLILTMACEPAIVEEPDLVPLLILKMVDISLRHGHSPASAFAFIGYGNLLGYALGQIDRGHRFAMLGLDLIDRFEARRCGALPLLAVEYLSRHWKEHLRRTLPGLRDAMRVAQDVGDIEHACYSQFIAVTHRHFLGEPLEQVDEAYEQAFEKALSSKHDLVCQAVLIWRHLARRLAGLPVGRDIAGPAALSDEELMELLTVGKGSGISFFAHVSATLESYYLGDPEAALARSLQAGRQLDAGMGTFALVLLNHTQSLACAALMTNASKQRRRELARIVKRNQRQMRKWAHHAPENHRHRYLLVEAERARLAGREQTAMAAYDASIAAATQSGFLHEAGLANELAMHFHLGHGRRTVAGAYLDEALYLYRLWGAQAKVDQLEREQDRLLVRAEKIRGDEPARSTTRPGGQSQLDLQMAMKATLAVSKEIVLESVLCKVLGSVLEIAGARRAVLLLERDGQLLIEAEGKAEVGEADWNVLQSRPLDDKARLALSVINYVMRTKDAVVLGNATREGLFSEDSHVAGHGVHSILCLPLLHQARLCGVLYAENELVQGAFTPGRLEILQLLASQVATSVQNARLYESLEGYTRTLEERVRQRTAALDRASAEAHEARANAEEANRAKSEFLASMSHELRTPLNAIVGYGELLEEEAVESGAESTAADLRRIRTAGAHLLEVINDVLDLSKVEAGKMDLVIESFDVDGLLDGIREMVQPLSDRGRNRFVVRKPTKLGKMRSDPTKLRQSLFNLLSNAFKFTEDAEVLLEASRHAGEAGEVLVFRVRDQGIGMTPSQVARVFEPFTQAETTTSLRFGGTGLGLTITKRFCELLGGAIECESTPGKGTTFTIRLPAGIQSESPAA